MISPPGSPVLSLTPYRPFRFSLDEPNGELRADDCVRLPTGGGGDDGGRAVAVVTVEIEEPTTFYERLQAIQSNSSLSLSLSLSRSLSLPLRDSVRFVRPLVSYVLCVPDCVQTRPTDGFS